MDRREQQTRPKINPWWIALTVSLATFMEVMDISIANVALRHIAGSVGADQSESTWVLTSYLISNAIVLPISGWLASVLGRKRFYMSCVALFTISSFACGLAPTLGTLLICRILQGAGGGGLAPSEQAILADTFPANQRGMAFAVYGVAVVVAPAIGPALGGWITDHYSWRWIFFINIPIGALSLFLTSILVEDSPSAKKEHQEATRRGVRMDFVGFALVAIGLGSLQIVMDKGQEDNWFASGLILTFGILAALGILGAVVWELWIARDPIVDLPLFRSRNFLFTNLMMFSTMFILLSTTQMLPQFVQQLLPYDATKAGLILMPGGFVIMLLMPVAGFLVRKIQPKYLIAAAFAGTSLGLFHLAGFETQMSFKAIALARVLQVASLAFLFVPIQTLAYSDLPQGKSNNASALINLMRNLGGSVGVSLGTTLLVRRSQIHQDRLVSHLTPTAPQFQQELDRLSHRFMVHGSGPVESGHQALAAIMHQVQIQAAMLSYLDIFVILMLGCLVAAALSTLLKEMDLSKAQAAA